MSSPTKKRVKIEEENLISKRENELEGSIKKRPKSEINEDPMKTLQTQKRKNFIIACEKVSYNNYFNLRNRFNLIILPFCVSNKACKHHDYKNGTNINQIPTYAEESFKIEMKTNMWFEALEVCDLCISPTQYLSSNVLKDIVEIILNANEDSYSEYSTNSIIDKCQQTLAKNFSTHPPCLVKTIRKCYNDFLTSPMDLKENTFSNRNLFECDKGIVKYCMNRLEYELSTESKDDALIDKIENTPEEMKKSVKGLHWQKEKLEIFEMLDRHERIKRLMKILESIVELLQFDLAIWHSKYTNNLGSHIMRSHKPLMAYLLWSNNVLYTGAVNNNCRQILKLFVYIVHLQYPEEYIRIMTIWLNTIVQTFYICENNSNSDFPNIGKYCSAFSNEFFKIISVLPHTSINRVLERIQPNYMQNLIATLYVKKLLSTEENNIIQIMINFIHNKQWLKSPESKEEIRLFTNDITKPKNFKRIMKVLSKTCKQWESEEISANSEICPKLELDFDNVCIYIDQNCIIHAIYIAMSAYLDAFSVQSVQDTIDQLNEQLLQEGLSANIPNPIPEYSSYSCTEQFIKKYRSIYQMLKELMLLLVELKNNGELPPSLHIFENIGMVS